MTPARAHACASSSPMQQAWVALQSRQCGWAASRQTSWWWWMCMRPHNELKPCTLLESGCGGDTESSMRHPFHICCKTFTSFFSGGGETVKDNTMCAGSVLPIWQTLFDVLARSSVSRDSDGKKVRPQSPLSWEARLLSASKELANTAHLSRCSSAGAVSAFVWHHSSWALLEPLSVPCFNDIVFLKVQHCAAAACPACRHLRSDLAPAAGRLRVSKSTQAACAAERVCVARRISRRCCGPR